MAATVERMLERKFDLDKEKARIVAATAKSNLGVDRNVLFSKKLMDECQRVAEEKGFIKDGKAVRAATFIQLRGNVRNKSNKSEQGETPLLGSKEDPPSSADAKLDPKSLAEEKEEESGEMKEDDESEEEDSQEVGEQPPADVKEEAKEGSSATHVTEEPSPVPVNEEPSLAPIDQELGSSRVNQEPSSAQGNQEPAESVEIIGQLKEPEQEQTPAKSIEEPVPVESNRDVAKQDSSSSCDSDSPELQSSNHIGILLEPESKQPNRAEEIAKSSLIEQTNAGEDPKSSPNDKDSVEENPKSDETNLEPSEGPEESKQLDTSEKHVKSKKSDKADKSKKSSKKGKSDHRGNKADRSRSRSGRGLKDLSAAATMEHSKENNLSSSHHGVQEVPKAKPIQLFDGLVLQCPLPILCDNAKLPSRNLLSSTKLWNYPRQHYNDDGVLLSSRSTQSSKNRPRAPVRRNSLTTPATTPAACRWDSMPSQPHPVGGYQWQQDPRWSALAGVRHQGVVANQAKSPQNTSDPRWSTPTVNPPSRSHSQPLSYAVVAAKGHFKTPQHLGKVDKPASPARSFSESTETLVATALVPPATTASDGEVNRAVRASLPMLKPSRKESMNGPAMAAALVPLNQGLDPLNEEPDNYAES